LDQDGNSLLSNSIEIATKLRLEGKAFHDKGDFVKAAKVFQEAADSLQENKESPLAEEYATCILHSALCHLKSEQFEQCLEMCTSILQDDENSAPKSQPVMSKPVVRARAYHRRAKAKLGLGDASGALQDARSAAFLGDRKAVALYGKLMRDSPSSPDNQNSFQSIIAKQQIPSNSPLLNSLLSESPTSNSDEFQAFSPASLLMGNGGSNLMGALGSGSNGLAKSVVNSLSNRLEEEDTQMTICNFLQKTSKSQLQQLAVMAGIADAIQEPHLDKIVAVCHGVTPRTIKRTVKNTKRALFGLKIIRRIVKTMNKYKSLLVALILLQWTKSAYLRPIPIDRVAAKRATKQALREAMKVNR
jgi:tetratricopeptide (TPR) repeat protein